MIMICTAFRLAIAFEGHKRASDLQIWQRVKLRFERCRDAVNDKQYQDSNSTHTFRVDINLDISERTTLSQHWSCRHDSSLKCGNIVYIANISCVLSAPSSTKSESDIKFSIPGVVCLSK